MRVSGDLTGGRLTLRKLSGHFLKRVSELANWGGKTHCKCEWYHPMSWIKMRRLVEGAWALVNLWFPTVDSVWPAASCFWVHAFLMQCTVTPRPVRKHSPFLPYAVFCIPQSCEKHSPSFLSVPLVRYLSWQGDKEQIERTEERVGGLIAS